MGRYAIHSRFLRRRWLAALAVALIVPVAVVFAVHLGGLFELGDGMPLPAAGSGDILGSGGQAGPDWADIFDPNGEVIDLFGGVVALFIQDPHSLAGASDPTVFAESNKNDDLISTWNWDTGNNPPKDDLFNVYTYAKLNADGDLIIYAGLERTAEEGDSHIDFEFNQDTIGLDKSVPCGDDETPDPDDGAPCEFTGEKTINDLLVVMDFERGGALGFVDVRKWDGTDYVLVEELLGEGCSDDDFICAFNNSVDIDGGPWLNIDRHADEVTELPPNAFTEIGINVTQLFGLTPCFGTIQAKTRSSQSFTSELKDFAFGNFDICKLSVDKTGPELSKIGDEATFTFSITNDGAVELDLVSAEDDQIGDLTAEAIAADCDPLSPGETCMFDVDFVIPVGADDPFVNVFSVEYDPDGAGSSPNLTDEDDHSVNLFQPCVDVDKTGDELSKVGDPVDYTITVDNCSSEDSPNLVNGTIVDTLLGDLLDAANTFVTSSTCATTLATGDSCVIEATRTVQMGDTDPLPNTVTVHYNPDGFPNDITDNDSHSVDLFQPSVTLVKTGDELSKVGDPVNYTITVTNTSSADSPDLSCTITDDLLGVNKNVNLAPGDVDVTNASYTVQPGDPDPLVNTATVDCTVDGFPNTVSASDDHTVNLFQPSVTLVKTGDELSKVGDLVNYTITVSNTSSGDSPNLDCTITDALLGINQLVNLAPGASQTISTSYTVQAGDPDPLVNTAEVTCSPVGFPNVLTASDSHTVNLFQPSVTLVKTGDELSKVGDPVNYTITVNNTSSADSPNLICTITDVLLGINQLVNMPPNFVQVTSRSYTVQPGDPDPLVNTASVSCSPIGFPNVLTASDSHTVNLFQPSVTLDKTGDELSKVGDSVSYTITVNNTSSADSPNLDCTITDALLGINKMVNLAPGASDVTNTSRTVLASDSDPLINTADVTCSPVGFPNVLTASDDHTVNLFQPGVDVEKTCGPATVTVGDPVSYTITITNTGSADSPSLVGGTIVDSLLGNLLDPANSFVTSSNCASTLATGTFCTIQASRTVLATDPDPLPNTVEVHYNPTGFPNDITDEASCSVDVQAGCALSPGFWKGGEGRLLWDQPTDLLDGNPVPFTTTTCFPWLAERLDPPPPGGADCTTYLGVLNLPAQGDVTIQLAFKYIAARLNQAASIGVPDDVADLLDAIDVYFASNPVGSKPSGAAKTQGQALLNALNTYFATVGEEDCPPASEL